MMLRSRISLQLLAGVVVYSFLSQAALADISGVVFRDFNANGLQDASQPQEPGIGGITITCTDATGGTGSTLSSYDPLSLGAYNLSGCTGQTRVEFSTSIANDYASTLSTNDNTSVRFVDGDQSNVNYGMNYPMEYCPADPILLVPAHYSGDGTGSSANLGSVYNFAASASGRATPPTIAINKGDIGTVWGTAYDNIRQRVYFASYLKRHAGLKSGLGSIFIASQSANTISYERSFDLQGVIPSNTGIAIELGSVCRSAVCANDAGNTGYADEYIIPPEPDTFQHDLDSFGKIAKTGLGAIELTPDKRQLWVVNLYQRALIRLDATQATTALPGNVEQYTLDSLYGTPTCTGGVLRPFALTFHRNKGYLGAVCDASISQQASDLKAHVLSFDPNNIIDGFSPVVSLNLNYNRGGDKDNTTRLIWAYFQWHPWLDVWNDFKIPSNYNSLYNAEPIVSDITFSEAGDLNIAIMDRFGDQMGQRQYLPISQFYRATEPRGHGDIIHFCMDNAGAYHVEGSAQCPATRGTSSGLGVNNNGEFFEDTAGDGVRESAVGSAVYVPGYQKILATVIDPHDPSYDNPSGDPNSLYTQGISSLNSTTGDHTNFYQIYGNVAGGQGKGNGLGEIEMLCPQAPIEIGNRVWIDANKDGIQDASEAGLANVEVQLLSGTNVIASAITDSTGAYYFSSANGSSSSSKIYNLTQLTPNTDYTIKVPSSFTISGDTYLLTSANRGKNNLLDSNALATGEVTIEAAELPMSGANNESFDIGYIPTNADLSINKTVSKSMVRRGESVSYTLEVKNSGPGMATNVEITDQLPAGLVYSLPPYSASQGSFDSSSGVWAVGNLNVGASATLTLNVIVK